MHYQKARAMLLRFGFEVAVRDVSKDAQALADLCWLDGSLMELPLVVIWQGEKEMGRLGRRDIQSGMSLRMRQLGLIRGASTPVARSVSGWYTLRPAHCGSGWVLFPVFADTDPGLKGSGMYQVEADFTGPGVGLSEQAPQELFSYTDLSFPVVFVSYGRIWLAFRLRRGGAGTCN